MIHAFAFNDQQPPRYFSPRRTVLYNWYYLLHDSHIGESRKSISKAVDRPEVIAVDGICERLYY